MKTIRWGIIGLGKIAHKFADDLINVKGSHLHAVASRSQEKADVFATTYKAAKRYTSYEELAQDPEIDVIYIATPHVFHKEHTLLCLKHKKAVLCEKPFAINKQEVDEMIAFAKAQNTLLMEALWTRMMPHYKFVLDEIASGKYGNVQTITADFGFKANFEATHRLYNKSLGGGSLLDIGIYPVFCALSILGKPDSIQAKAHMGESGVDEEITIDFEYHQKQKAHLQATLKRKTPTTASIICEHGLFYLHGRFHEGDKVTSIHKGIKTEHDFNYSMRGYNFEIEHIAALLREDIKESPLMTYDFSKLLISTLDEIRDCIQLEY